MAKVGVQRAVELTGKSKSTIQRAMNSGKLSFTKSDSNRRLIDVSELERVFGVKEATAVTSPTSNVEAELQKAKDILETERMKMRIRTLEDKLHVAETQIEDLKSQRDQWQKQAQQVLITSQFSQKQAEDLKAEIKEREARARARRTQQQGTTTVVTGSNENSTTATSIFSKILGKSKKVA